MKKFLHHFLIHTILTLVFALTMTIPSFAYCTRSGNFNRGYQLTGDLGRNMVAVAEKQLGRTKASLGYTEAWCADFVLDCARLAGVPVSVIPYSTPANAGCGNFINSMKQHGGVEIGVGQAQPGDLVFYYCSSCKAYTHVGIYAGNGYFIEGNLGGKVTKYSTNYIDSHSHSTKGGVIRRIYIRPNYNNISAAQVTLTRTSFTYNGLAQVPGITVKCGGAVLKSGTDYSVSYSGVINAGTARIQINGKGKYKGSKTVTYTIAPYNINNFKTLTVSTQTYTGKALTPGLQVFDNLLLMKNFKKGSAYTVAYASNVKPGRGTVTVTGRGNFTGKKVITMYIRPSKVTGVKAKVSGRNITLSWKGAASVSGYEITYRKKGAKKWTTVRTNTLGTSYAIRKLGILTSYEMQVRAYVNVSGGRLYGNWSSTTKARTGLF